MARFLRFLIALALTFPAVAVAQGAQKGTVAGKSGVVQTATPITSTATWSETTAGFQTEAGAIQERGVSAGTPSPKQGPKAIGPLRPEQAGQSRPQSDTNAQAATRAEMYPGITLGVDLKSAPQSPEESVALGQKHLEKNTQKTPQH